jgi:predicted O-linked N-acetylglucosamine transferase (SPINDLY family)
MARLRKEIRHPDVSFVPFPDRLRNAADQIRQVECDLLYFWEVGTDTLNYFLTFAGLAPVQCTSWGIQVTTGVPSMDYYISSDLVEVQDAQSHYCEKLVHLPSLLSCQPRAARPDPPATRAEFGLPTEAHLYACLQRPLKLHPDFDILLAEVLRRDSSGLVLLLKGHTGNAAAQVGERHRATIGGVADRIVWMPTLERVPYQRLLSLAEVVLDPLPYGTGNSAYDIFSYDLPMVTLPGTYNAGRYAQACYRRMGLMELVAGSPEEYVEVAVRLGTDEGFRRDTVARIARASDALFDDLDIVRAHEQFFGQAIAESRAAARRVD